MTNTRHRFASDCAWLAQGGSSSIKEDRFKPGDRIIKEYYDDHHYRKEGSYTVLFAGTLSHEQVQEAKLKAEHLAEPFSKSLENDPTQLEGWSGNWSQVGIVIRQRTEQVTIQQLEVLLK